MGRYTEARDRLAKRVAAAGVDFKAIEAENAAREARRLQAVAANDVKQPPTAGAGMDEKGAPHAGGLDVGIGLTSGAAPPVLIGSQPPDLNNNNRQRDEKRALLGKKKFEDSDFDDSDRAPYMIRHPEPAYVEYHMADEFAVYAGTREIDASYGAEDDPLKTRVGQPPNPNPRRPREEGLYVDPEPFIPHNEYLVLDGRLLRADPYRQKYFDEDGRILGLNDRVSTRPIRPVVKVDGHEFPPPDPAVALYTSWPIPFTDKNQSYMFHINFGSVTFTDHPLFNKEDYLCMYLERVYVQYKQLEVASLIRFYSDRVLELRRLYRKQRAEHDRLDGGAASAARRKIELTRQMVDTLERVLEARRARDYAEHEVFGTIALLYRIWEEIRYFRVAKTVSLQRAGLMRSEPEDAKALEARLKQQAADDAINAKQREELKQKQANDAAAAALALHQQQQARAAAEQQHQQNYLNARQAANDAAVAASNQATAANALALAAQRALDDAVRRRDETRAKRALSAAPPYPVPAAGVAGPTPEDAAKKAAADASHAAALAAVGGDAEALRAAEEREDKQQDEEIARLRVELTGASSAAVAASTAANTAAAAAQAAAAPMQPLPAANLPPAAAAAAAAAANAPYKEADRQQAYDELKREVKGKKTYAGQRIALRLIPMKSDYSADREDWDNTLRDEMRERRDLLEYQSLIRYISGNPLSEREATFNDERERTAVEQRMMYYRRRPGNHLYQPTIVRNVELTDTAQVDLEEKKRRQDIADTRIYLELFVNDNLVVKTEIVPLQWPSFRVDFKQETNLQLLGRPASITCQLIEYKKGWWDRPICEAIFPVPEYGTPPNTQNFEFGGTRIETTFPHMPDTMLWITAARREWKDAEEREASRTTRYINCSIDAALWWPPTDVPPPDMRAQALAADPSFRDYIGGAVGVGGKRRGDRNAIVQGKAIAAAAGKHKDKIDPNDPRNAALIEYLKGQRNNGNRFRCAEIDEDLYLVPREYFVDSGRKVVLLERAQNPSMQVSVPLNDAQIQATAYGEMLRNQAKNQGLTPDQIARRNQAEDRKKLRNIRKTTYRVEDKVKEGALPVFTWDFTFFDEILKPRRTLRARREKLKPVTAPKECHIIVQVVKGQNLPVRYGGRNRPVTAQAVDEKGVPIGGPNAASANPNDNVRPFVEIRFQDSASGGAGNASKSFGSQRTVAKRGSNPRWDEIVVVPFNAPPEQAALQHINDDISFNLFDEVVSDVEVDNPQLKATYSSRVERRWLGAFNLPWSTLYLAGTVFGTFRVELPLNPMGYVRPQPRVPTTLELYITLDPPLLTPPPPELPDTTSLSRFHKYCIEWEGKLRMWPQCKNRHFTALVSDIERKPSVVCQYIKPVHPPNDFANDPAAFRRFVATIPYRADHDAFENGSDVWCTCSQFIIMGNGDWEEHAVLLCNYYLAYDYAHPLDRKDGEWRTYVILGHGTPEGKTAYVCRLRVLENAIRDVILINPVTGLEYNRDDEFSETLPLKQIGCVINADNVWVNTQPSDRSLRDLSWNLLDSTGWTPLFRDNERRSEEFRAEMQNRTLAGGASTAASGAAASATAAAAAALVAGPSSGVSDQPRYFNIDQSVYVNRASRIERLLERKLESWREGIETHWNFAASGFLRDLLTGFERVEQKRSDALIHEGQGLGSNTVSILDTDDRLTSLKHMWSGLYGVSLQFKESEEDSTVYEEDGAENPIIKALQNTRIHESDDPTVNFALAVYIYPHYPNCVASIWLYVARLTQPMTEVPYPTRYNVDR